MTGPIICVGAAVLDQIYGVATLPSGAGKHFAGSYRETGGGPAANGAVAIARLGGRAALWARVGSDEVGVRIVGDLAREDIDVSGIRRIEGAVSGVSAIIVDDDGERMIVNHADPRLDRDPSWLPLGNVDSAGAVLADLRWPEGAIAALTRARASSLPAILDADTTPDVASVEAMMAATHVLFSQPALRTLSGDEDIAAALAIAANRIGGWVGVTCGADGVYWLESGSLRHLPAFPVRTVDTTGAGDVFHGAFALAIARGEATDKALRFASAAAAIKCTRFGGRDGIPVAADIEHFLKDAAA
ncbi:PfkB family carbohydrate kinase [Inquilinus sp. CAU 1745]|uniref:PfkB family carbohydrate kinase n=1 Tax=Inquilinus sp. CAU 1745 TaxID=3140369 RepID=UPI00325A59B1